MAAIVGLLSTYLAASTFAWNTQQATDSSNEIDLAGQVVLHGRGVPNVPVTLMPNLDGRLASKMPAAIAETKSDSTGNFVLRVTVAQIRSGIIRARFRSALYSVAYPQQILRDDDRLREEQLVLALGTCVRRKVRVTDAEGKPVPNALVRAFRADRDVWYSETDERGLAYLLLPSSLGKPWDPELEGILAVANDVGGRCILSPKGKSNTANSLEDRIKAMGSSKDWGTWPPKSLEPIELQLTPPRKLSVHVVLGDGQPAVEQKVSVHLCIGDPRQTSGRWKTELTTNADGEASLTYVRSMPYARVTFESEFDDSTQSVAKPLMGNKSTAMKVDLSGLRKITGTVKHAGKPTSGVQVTVVSGDQSKDLRLYRQRTLTRGDGSYSINALADVPSMVWVSHPTLGAPAYHTTIQATGVEAVDFSLREKVPFTGIARDSKGPLASVKISAKTEGDITVAHTDEKGRFQFQLLPGRYEFTATKSLVKNWVSVGNRGLQGKVLNFPSGLRARAWGVADKLGPARLGR